MEAEAASFNTEILSISSGLIVLMDETTPSTTTIGLLLFKVPIPRIRMLPTSRPGWPLLCVTVTPAIVPCKAEVTFVTGLFSRSLAEILETDPVRLIFFVVP